MIEQDQQFTFETISSSEAQNVLNISYKALKCLFFIDISEGSFIIKYV